MLKDGIVSTPGGVAGRGCLGWRPCFAAS